MLALVGSLLASLPETAGANPGFVLSVPKTGAGSVASDVVPGIDCGATCSYDFAPSTFVTLIATPNADYRPDQWIQLCGLSDGCTIHPLPNPTKGKNVYNSTGARQTLDLGIEQGEGIRYWLTLENDGALDDTFTVQGCRGNSSYKINNVQVGFYKRPTAGSVKITQQFIAGKAEFDMPAGGPVVELTLNILSTGKVHGVHYTCRVTIVSQGDPGATDTVVGKLVTI